MRKIKIFGLAAAIAALPVVSLAMPAASAQARSHQQAQSNHRWNKGERFDRNRADHYAVVDYHRYHGLRAPPRGYHWVRSGNDAVLVAISTGVIASVIANAIR